MLSGCVSIVDKSFARRLRLNSSIVKNKYFVLPVDDVGHENYTPVGRGKKSSSLCGRWVGLNVCKNFEGHEGKLLNGEDCTDKVVNYNRHLWCKKSSCPVCFIRGWSVRGARSIFSRFVKAVQLGLGKVEHIVVSPPVAEGRVLPESALRKICRKALVDRGILGGCMIFHGYPMNKERTSLVWRPHYHVVGFVVNGYRCRGCTLVCSEHPECNGFERRTRFLNESDGCIVKVLPERKTVFGTAFYQLNHATIRLGVKRFHVVTWFGSCGNRKFKSVDVEVGVTCPVCHEEMVRAVFVGKERIVKDVGHPDYKAVFLCDEFDEDGQPNYVDVVDGG